MHAKLIAYAQLLRLDRPVGTLLLGWSTLWGLWLAGHGRPSPLVVFILLLGTLSTRSLGCVLNDWADRAFDGHVQRTRQRPLARGALSGTEALGAAALLAGLSLLLLLPLNRASGLVALYCLAVLAIYPFCKRFLALPQAVLGLAFAAPILMAEVALTGSLSVAGLCLYLASAVWALVYDTFYALVDRDDDRALGLHSSALWATGRETRFLAAMMALMLALLLLAGLWAGLNGWYYAGLAAAALLFLWELWTTRDLNRDACFRAFLHNNWVGAALWLGLVLAHLP